MTNQERLDKLADLIKLHPNSYVKENAMLYDLRMRAGHSPLPDQDVQVEEFHQELDIQEKPTDPDPDCLECDGEAFHDLLGELGREVFNLLDDCETSGPIGDETHTITSHSLEKLSDLLDKIEALPVIPPPNLILGPGAILQHVLTELLTSKRA